MKKLVVLILLLWSAICFGQKENSITKDTTMIDLLEITSTPPKLTPMPISLLAPRQFRMKIEKVESKLSKTTAEVLENSGQVYIQRSQAAGGSPVIRGLEGNKVLLLMDGIRLNNAITRGGHSQQTILMDQHTISDVNLLYGSSSVLYGTDALGGSINFFTKSPFAETDTFQLSQLTASFQTGSANFEKQGHLDLIYGTKKLSFISSVTYADFDNIRIGARATKGQPNWGKQDQFVATSDQGDQIINNLNPLRLQNTGYSQFNGMQKARWHVNQNLMLELSSIYTTSSNINRYDKLNEFNNSIPRYAQWHYGPQKHWINSLHVNYEKANFFFDNYTLIAAFQNYNESRYYRLFNDSLETSNIETVKSFSLTHRFKKEVNDNTIIRYGMETYLNDIKSVGAQTNINTKVQSSAPSRFPDGKNTYFTNGIFIDGIHFFSDHFKIISGVRYEYLDNRSTFNADLPFNIPNNNIQFNNHALVGKVGLNYELKRWNLTGMLSKGFRSPNLDDYGKFRVKRNNIILPSRSLKPEQTYNAESFIQYATYKTKFSFSPYYTILNDAITRVNGTIEGQDSIFFDGRLNQVQYNANTSRAQITGATLGYQQVLTEKLDVFMNITYTYGKDLTNNVPLGHIPPLYGTAGLVWSHKKWESGINILYNGNKSIELYSPTGVDNEDAATLEGTPSWVLCNSFVSYNAKHFNYSLGIDNMFDQHVRNFSSGISQPGINFWFKVKYTL